ncbi:hypothetical protein [Diplocloster modestus]|uniref:Uncharacterized protein n=1 Tax=Diplocloster modestus TaxID=2850322 RepID=A0ABS6KAT5_9FIRM|nr:hypothetical protein [Diplocloster modestus]MBU9727622.1 hypothetical protein [Diplocloster modestus]
MKIGFYLPVREPPKGVFGCASLGMTGISKGREPDLVLLPYELAGYHIYGTYSEALDQLEKLTEKSLVKAAIILFGNVGKEEWFLEKFSNILDCPAVGGGAAADENGRSGLISHGTEVNLFLITDERYEYQISMKNIYPKVLEEVCLKLCGKRKVLQINGIEADSWLAQKKAGLGLPAADFEHLTLTTIDGVNAHLSVQNGEIVSGRNLEEKMQLRYIRPEEVQQAVTAFYQDSDSVVFGCAGIKGMLDKEIITLSPGLFLFGEVCTVMGIPMFGNLMLSKLKITKKK